MKIVHICLTGPYTDNWGYQENNLPRAQIRRGNEVYVIANCEMHEASGEIVSGLPREYTLSDGVVVIRISEKALTPNKKINRLLSKYDIFEILERLQPNIIFVHGIGARFYNRQIIKYHRLHPQCVVMADTHAIPENVGKTKNIIGILLRNTTKYYRKQLLKVCRVLYGITPACIDYAHKEYGVPYNKMKLLPLGYDSSICNWEQRDKIRREFRKKLGLSDDIILIVHGGKIIPRRRTQEAIAAVGKINNPKVKLIVFGDIAKELKESICELIKENHDKVIYLGQLSQKEYYDVYLASDIGLFPGGQSVLWQEAIGCGLPLIVNWTSKIEYLDRGGNVDFVDGSSVEELYSSLIKMINDNKYQEMAKISATAGRSFFSYDTMSQMIEMDAFGG